MCYVAEVHGLNCERAGKVQVHVLHCQKVRHKALWLFGFWTQDSGVTGAQALV